MAKHNYDDVMKMLKAVPGVEEHLKKPSVIQGKRIAKRRIELGLTQLELVKVAREKGIVLTQATISKAEAGHEGVTNGSIDRIIEALGGIEDLELSFKVLPKRKQLVGFTT
jgi:transcriptional regulator with XRE-family HTH domain